MYVLAPSGRDDRQDLADLRRLGQGVDEARVDDVDRVDLAGDEVVDGDLGNRADVVERHVVAEAGELGDDVLAGADHEVAALLADRDDREPARSPLQDVAAARRMRLEFSDPSDPGRA